MATATLDQLKKKLNTACESLRGFTLGHSGYTKKDGLEAIRLVSKLCDKMSKLPKSEWGGPNPTMLIAVGRGRIRAAEARLAVLEKMH